MTSRRLLLDVWPVVLAVVLYLPLLTDGGYPLARDLVFVPHQPFTPAVLGLGDVAPRAVPLDALVSLLTSVVDGGVLARVLLPLLLAVAGWGAHRLVRDLGWVARLAAAGFAVWNPYVVERLALGQWALLTAYAALPWLALAARRYRAEGRLVDLASVVLWLALASVTPSGGLIGLATMLALGAARSWRTLRLALVGFVLQLPWVVSGLVGSAGLMSDPAGVAAFAARAEAPGGVVVSVLGLGGIWDSFSVPATRESWWGLTAALFTVLVIAGAWTRLRALEGMDRQRWTVLAGGSVVLALASSTPWGADALRWAVQTLPGAGLLRDSQKFLAPFVVLVVAAFAATVDLVLSWAMKWGREVGWSAGILTVGLPVALMPDAATAVWPTVEPVQYPASVVQLDELFPDPGASPAVTLPWRSYRRFDWGNGLISSDPAPRLLDREVLVRDDLQVGETTVRGESVLARELGAALASHRAADALAGTEIGWALVYRDDPAADELDLTGLELYAETLEVAVYRVPPPSEPMPTPVDEGFSDELPRTTMIITGDLAAALVVVGAAAARIRLRNRRSDRWR